MPYVPLISWPQESKDKLGYIVIFTALFVTGLMWYTNEIKQGQLLTEVNVLHPISFFETTWLYAYLLAFTGVFPLLFGFIPKPNFYGQFLRVALANIPVGITILQNKVYGVFPHVTRPGCNSSDCPGKRFCFSSSSLQPAFLYTGRLIQSSKKNLLPKQKT